MLFPYRIGEFYKKTEIWRRLGIAGQGGIRPNRRQNFVVVFINSPDGRPRPGRSQNIYADFYDRSSGLFRYTGEGQKGDQKLSRGNRWLAEATANESPIHLFEQHHAGGLHEYVGEVKVVSYQTEVQRDVDGIQRKVLIFLLQPLSTGAISEGDPTSREIESEIATRKAAAPSRRQLEIELKKLRELVAKRGPLARGLVTRTASQYVRFKAIVVVLKMFYNTECQICGQKHFDTETGVYSEVHHLTPWSRSHDDRPENLVVICANCHRKLHYATPKEVQKMFTQLAARFPNVGYSSPTSLYQ